MKQCVCQRLPQRTQAYALRTQGEQGIQRLPPNKITAHAMQGRHKLRGKTNQKNTHAEAAKPPRGRRRLETVGTQAPSPRPIYWLN